MEILQWIESNFQGITSVYEIYHQYSYLGPKPMPFPEFINILHKKYEVYTKRKQVKNVKYTKYIIV
jgi:hypothetical protein